MALKSSISASVMAAASLRVDQAVDVLKALAVGHAPGEHHPVLQTHRLRHLQARVPVLARNARVVHLAGDNLERFARKREMITFHNEGRIRTESAKPA